MTCDKWREVNILISFNLIKTPDEEEEEKRKDKSEVYWCVSNRIIGLEIFFTNL